MSIVIDPDLRKVGRLELALHGVEGDCLKGAGLLQQIEVTQDGAALLSDIVLGGCELLPEGGPLDLKLTQLVTMRWVSPNFLKLARTTPEDAANG